MLKRIAPGQWGLEWLLLFVALLGVTLIGRPAMERRNSRAWVLQTEGEVATARIIDVQRGTITPLYKGEPVEGPKFIEYFVTLDWIDYHKAHQRIENWRFYDFEAKRLGLVTEFGETSRKTLRIRYKLPTETKDVSLELKIKEARVAAKQRPWCFPSDLCALVQLDNHEMADPGDLYGFLPDPAPWLLGGGLLAFAVLLCARALGRPANVF